jgi:hypothetical protein
MSKEHMIFAQLIDENKSSGTKLKFWCSFFLEWLLKSSLLEIIFSMNNLSFLSHLLESIYTPPSGGGQCLAFQLSLLFYWLWEWHFLQKVHGGFFRFSCI